MKFIRQLIAKAIVYTKPEWGGILHDYKNGLWDQLIKWEDDEGAEQALDLVDNMVGQERDAIYIACIKVGNGRGFFYIVNSHGRIWSRAFWDKLYPANEAFREISVIARQVANEMGWRQE